MFCKNVKSVIHSCLLFAIQGYFRIRMNEKEIDTKTDIKRETEIHKERQIEKIERKRDKQT